MIDARARASYSTNASLEAGPAGLWVRSEPSRRSPLYYGDWLWETDRKPAAELDHTNKWNGVVDSA